MIELILVSVGFFILFLAVFILTIKNRKRSIEIEASVFYLAKATKQMVIVIGTLQEKQAALEAGLNSFANIVEEYFVNETEEEPLSEAINKATKQKLN